MDKSRLLHLEKLMTTRKTAIFSRLLWEMDGEVFSTNPRREGARPLDKREFEELVAELNADPQTRPILKRHAGDLRRMRGEVRGPAAP